MSEIVSSGINTTDSYLQYYSYMYGWGGGGWKKESVARELGISSTAAGKGRRVRERGQGLTR